MKIYYIPKNCKNVISTILIGKKFYEDWYKFSYPSWIKYCKKHNLGLIVFKKYLVDKKNPKWKISNWHKLLIGEELNKNKLKIKNVCYLDADILINFVNSPNIFKIYKEQGFGLISQVKNLPYKISTPIKSNGLSIEEYSCRKRMAFFRNKYFSKRYPLDSSLFMPLHSQYKYIGVKPKKDYACTGVIVFNLKKHSKILKKIFFKYKMGYKNLASEETYLNFELQNYKIQWLDYKFQSLWAYEIPHYYSFLYKNEKNKELVRYCIRNSLMNNYFLHFAGSWNECQMWKTTKIFDKKTINEWRQFEKYYLKKPKGIPLGKIAPKN
jgi:hypothetical protein